MRYDTPCADAHCACEEMRTVRLQPTASEILMRTGPTVYGALKAKDRYIRELQRRLWEDMVGAMGA